MGLTEAPSASSLFGVANVTVGGAAYTRRMNRDLKALTAEVLALAPADRMALARELANSFDASDDDIAELRRRIADAEQSVAAGGFDDMTARDFRSYLSAL